MNRSVLLWLLTAEYVAGLGLAASLMHVEHGDRAGRGLAPGAADG